jgi:hypothetical protein
MKTSVTMLVALLWLGSALMAAQTVAENYETFVKDVIETVQQINKTLGEIKDRPSAEAAKPELKKNAEKLLELRKLAEQAKEPSKADKDRLEKEYAGKMAATIKKLQDETIRVNDIPGGREAVAELAILKEKKDASKDKKAKN